MWRRCLIPVVHGLLGTILCGGDALAVGSIGLFFDADATHCGTQQAIFTTGTLYVVAIGANDVSAGVSGARFRIDGFPAGWLAGPLHLNPAATVAAGDPLGNGITLATAPCQFSSDGRVLLFSFDYVATTSVTDQRLRVVTAVPPEPIENCPFIVKCDQLTFACVAGGQALINSSSGACSVGTVPSSWTSVKHLYE